MSYSSILYGSPLSLKYNASGVNKKSRKVCCFRPDTNIGGSARKQYNILNASNVNGHVELNKPPIVKSPLPPGPSFLYLMGLLHYVVGSFPYHHPLRDLAKAYGPLVHVKLGEVSNIVVSSAELAKEVLKTRESCLNRPKSIGTQIIVNVWAIGRDPVYWENPERFDMSPIDFMGAHFEFIPFGAGKRICPGMALGLANADYLLAKLLYHFDWKLPPGMSRDDIDMRETDGMAVSRKNNLYLIATPYVPAT